MEVWKPLKNFPGYNGSSEGRIMNVRTQRILKSFMNDRGYELVCLRRGNKQYTVKVGRVIAETFLGDHPGMDVGYRNNDRLQNDISNLEWRTRRETIRVAYDRGTKIPSKQIAIRVIETGAIYNSIRACARDLGCHQYDISRCLHGKSQQVNGYHFELA